MRVFLVLCITIITLSATSCAVTIGKVVGAERACIAERQASHTAPNVIRYEDLVAEKK